MAKEFIERGAVLEKVIEVKHHDPELSGVVLHRYIKEIDLKDIPAADVVPVVHGELTEHIHELLRAEQDGRLVVLPCKVGDTLWVTGRDNVPREMELEAPDIRTVCTDEDNLCMSTCNRKPDGFCAYRLRNDGADIGKTVFLTREEAEKALEARENG
jgi:hypothetical protein